MKKKIKVVILMGGKSSEREVSLSSGHEVLKNLNKDKYLIKSLVIPKLGNNWINELMREQPDIVFIALHGPYGEDGSVQGLLENLGFPYTGSGILASAVGMDKVIFKKLMRSGGVDVPKDVDKAPCFVKPADQGSSVGSSVVLSQDQIDGALNLAKKYSKRILIEEYIKGREFTCPVLGNEVPFALPVIEIKPLKGNFFDYQSKYTKGGSEEIVPAPISDTLSKQIQELAIKVYKALACSGFARVDFILTENGRLVVLEINTIPGLTAMSLVPKSAKAAGISYSELLDKIINYAIEK